MVQTPTGGETLVSGLGFDETPKPLRAGSPRQQSYRWWSHVAIGKKKVAAVLNLLAGIENVFTYSGGSSSFVVILAGPTASTCSSFLHIPAVLPAVQLL